VVFTSSGKQNNKTDTRTDKANAGLHELYRSVVTKRELWKTARLSVFKTGLRSEHLQWSRILDNGWKSAISNTSERDGIFSEEFTKWHFPKQCTVVKSIKLWMYCSSSSPPNREMSDTMVRTRDRNARGKIGGACWLHPRKSGPKVDQRPGGVITSLASFSPVSVWNQQKYQRLLKTVRYFESS